MATRPPTQNRVVPMLFLFGTLILAVGAGYLVLQVVNRSQQLAAEAAKPKETKAVVVALHDLYMGVPITDQDVAVVQLDPVAVPEENTFRSLDEVRGRTPRERILTNELIREERLARPDAGVGLNAIISPGKRAFTVATDTETAVAGLLQPGNYVDIIVTIRPEDPAAMGAKWVSKTILEGIKVLAVGSALSPAGSAPDPKDKNAKPAPSTNMRNIKPSITLELLPEEAEMLALAVSQGDIHVTLRTDTDFTQVANQGVTTASRIIGEPTAVQPPPSTAVAGTARNGGRGNPPPTTDTTDYGHVTVISGSDQQNVPLSADGSADISKKKNR